MTYSPEERETTIVCTDAEKEWTVYTLMPSVIRKIKRLGVQPIKVESDGAHYFRLNFEQISFRSGKRKISEEQRKKASDRMKRMHEKRKGK